MVEQCMDGSNKQLSIVLLTSRFPCCENVESFLVPELEKCPDDVQISVMPVSFDTKETIKQKVPDNVVVQQLFDKPFSVLERIVNTFCFVFSKAFWKEISYINKTKRLSGSNLKTLLIFGARAYRKYHTLKKMFRNGKPDIIYSYWMNNSAFAAALISKNMNILSICRTHGADLYEERNNGYLPMRRFIIENMTKVFPVSRIGEEYLVSRYGNSDKIECRYLGTDNPHVIKDHKRSEWFCIVSCAYMVPLKRITLIAKAIGLLNGFKIRWVHFGDGEEMESVKKIVEEYPSDICAELYGNVSNDRIMQFYQENYTDLFLNASTTEGVPVSVMEAISFGIPVIATDVGGTKEVIQDGSNGFLLPKDITEKDIADSIRKMINMNDIEYEKMRESARSIWENKFCSKKNYASFYLDLKNLTDEGESK